MGAALGVWIETRYVEAGAIPPRVCPSGDASARSPRRWATTAPALLPSAKHSYLFNGWRVLGRKSSNPSALLPNPEPIGGSLLQSLKVIKNVKKP
jgi:hypothetical protein